MADWVFDDYVTGGTVLPDFEPPPFRLMRLDAFARSTTRFRPRRRVHVHGIDVNEEWYGGAAGFREVLSLVMRQMPAAGPVDAFLQSDSDTPAAEIDAIERVRVALEANRPELIATWGPDWYDHVVEMTDVERASIDIRVERQKDDNGAARAREQEIKRIADLRIGGFPSGTVINIGGHHAQKAHLTGTDQEWLGDYLVHRSGATGGSVFIVGVSSAEPCSSRAPLARRSTCVIRLRSTSASA